jgi:hypothetical protein
MKKIFTLFAGLVMAVAVMAADRGPSVTISSNKNYKIMIDGRSYFGSNTSIQLNNLMSGTHTIKVYEMKKGFFSRERLVSTSSFKLNRKDISIKVDNFGRIFVTKERGRDWNDNRDWRDRDNDHDGPSRRF